MSYDDSPTMYLSAGCLIGLAGTFAGSKIDLNHGEEVIIGKDSSMCSVVIDSAYKEISRKHVSITYDMSKDQYCVIDYSSNGTLVNGQRLASGTKNYFSAGAKIELANNKNVFQIGETAKQVNYQQPTPQPQSAPQPMQQPTPQPQSAPQPMQQPVYAQPMPQYAQQEPKKGRKGMAIASMVLGIVSIAFGCCIPYITFITALVGLILGAVSLAKKKPGKGMAIAGLICSIVALAPAIYVLVAGASILSSVGV